MHAACRARLATSSSIKIQRRPRHGHLNLKSNLVMCHNGSNCFGTTWNTWVAQKLKKLIKMFQLQQYSKSSSLGCCAALVWWSVLQKLLEVPYILWLAITFYFDSIRILDSVSKKQALKLRILPTRSAWRNRDPRVWIRAHATPKIRQRSHLFLVEKF